MSDAALQDTGSQKRPQFQASAETRLLYARLRDMQIGETVTYEDLGGIIGQDVQGDGRSALVSARRLAQRDDGIIIDAVRGVGIKRLTDSEAVATGAGTFTRIRRLATRAVKRLTTVNYDALSQADKTSRDASLAAFAVAKLMAKPKSLQRIAANTSNTGELPIARTLELFRGPKASE